MSSFDRYAGIVRQLIRFTEVREYFKWHVSRWRKKQSLIQENLAKAEKALKPWARRKRVPTEWPLHRVRIGKNSRLIQVPPELLQKVAKRENRREGSLLTRLTRKPVRELTPSERITLLAQIHDACYANHHLGPTDLRAYERGKGHYLASVAVLESDLAEGRRLTKSEGNRLHDVLGFVLARIEARFVPTTKDENGELLVDVIARLRKEWELHSTHTLVAQSRMGMVTSERRSDDPTSSSDTKKKPKKKSKPRMLDAHCKACIKEFKAYRKSGDPCSMLDIVRDYVAQNKGLSETGLYRRLNDNSSHWNPHAD